MRIEYFRSPTPHAVIQQLVAPEIYAQIRFPDIAPRPMGRIGRDIYFGEPEWAELMIRPGWAELSATFVNEDFMRRLIDSSPTTYGHMVVGLTPTKSISRSAQRIVTRPSPNYYPNPTIPMLCSSDLICKQSTRRMRRQSIAIICAG